MNRIQIVQGILNRLAGKTYLEIGTERGYSFFPIQAERKLAVDPKLKLRIKFTKRLKRTFTKIFVPAEEKYFKMTSDDFFITKSDLLQNKKIDVALVDGAHTYRQSVKDVFNCLKYLNKNGVIVIHDCNPKSEAMAYPALSFQDAEKMKLPGWEEQWCGDVWKTIVHLRSLSKDLCVFVLDCDFGIGIAARGRPENTLDYSVEDIERMSYHDLESQRKRLLNLKPQDFLQDFLEKINPN